MILGTPDDTHQLWREKALCLFTCSYLGCSYIRPAELTSGMWRRNAITSRFFVPIHHNVLTVPDGMSFSKTARFVSWWFMCCHFQSLNIYDVLHHKNNSKYALGAQNYLLFARGSIYHCWQHVLAVNQECFIFSPCPYATKCIQFDNLDNSLVYQLVCCLGTFFIIYQWA